MRVFIMYAEDGQILSVSQVEVMPDGVEHPFYLDDPTHGVLELGPEDEIAKRLLQDETPEKRAALILHDDYRVDTKDRRLRKSVEAGAADESAKTVKAAESSKTMKTDESAKTTKRRAADEVAKRRSGEEKA
jgi:hypothetical protein